MSGGDETGFGCDVDDGVDGDDVSDVDDVADSSVFSVSGRPLTRNEIDQHLQTCGNIWVGEFQVRVVV